MARKISVVTGGHGGMGKAIALELGKKTSVLLADMNEEKLNDVNNDLKSLGIETFVKVCDVTDKKQVQELASYADSLGDVVNVIHTSGVSPTLCKAPQVIRVNALGTVNMTDAFASIIADGGVMVNFSSVAAYQLETQDEWIDIFEQYYDSDELYDRLYELVEPFADNDFNCAGMAYCIAKRFVIYYSQMNVDRFARRHARILSVSPGSHLTPMHQALIDLQPEIAEGQLADIPAGRWGHPYEISSLIAYLVSEQAAFLNGIDILQDGGQTAKTFVTQIGD